MNIKLLEAIPKGSLVVSLLYDDKLAADLDLAPALEGPVFEPMKDPGYFARLEIVSETIRWPNGADIDPDVLRFWTELGRVVSQEETDAHFAAVLGTTQKLA